MFGLGVALADVFDVTKDAFAGGDAAEGGVFRRRVLAELNTQAGALLGK